jgi:hypothetical protein
MLPQGTITNKPTYAAPSPVYHQHQQQPAAPPAHDATHPPTYLPIPPPTHPPTHAPIHPPTLARSAPLPLKVDGFSMGAVMGYSEQHTCMLLCNDEEVQNFCKVGGHVGTAGGGGHSHLPTGPPTQHTNPWSAGCLAPA